MLDMFFWHIGVQDVDMSIPYYASTIHGTRDLHNTIEQLDQHTQIDWQNGSFDTFEVLVLHTPLHHRALIFCDQFQKTSNDV